MTDLIERFLDGWERNIVEPGKHPMLLMLACFVLTFLIVRGIVRLIRAGRGPFRNVSTGAVHIHHLVPGTLLLFGGAALSISGVQALWSDSVAAVLIGVGGGLVFDEFALLLYLDDVYWTPQGRLSIEMVTIVVIVMMCILVGVSPIGIDNITVREFSIRITLQIHFVLCAVGAAICLLKGKYYTAVWAVFFALVALIGAVRLARPGSVWAHRFYRPGSKKERRAQHRIDVFEGRWGKLGTRMGNVVAGAVSQPYETLPADERDAAAKRRGPASGGTRGAEPPVGQAD
jgi:hypothetical protein